MTPQIGAPGLGWPELLIILAVVLILFGGSRLAGLGKSTGRALREFKEETKGMTGGDKDKTVDVDPQLQGHPTVAHPVPGEIVEPSVTDVPRSDLPRTDLPRADQPQAFPETRRDS